MSEPTIDAVCAAIVTLTNGLTATTVDGTVLTIKASDPPPKRQDLLMPASLPALYILTGEAVDNETVYGAQAVEETRSYKVRVAVASKYQDTLDDQVALREKMCRPLIKAIKGRLRAYPHLGAVSGVRRAVVTGDSGPIDLPEYENALGLEVRLSVATILSRTYAPGE